MICHCKKTTVLFLIFALLFSLTFACLTGCSEKNTGENSGDGVTEKKEVVHLPPASPAMGVGRVMPGLYVDRDELILIDPGHGFDDPGAGDTDASWWKDLEVRERDVTLAVAKMLDEELQARGFRTMMTHDGVTFPEEFNYDGNNKFMPDERAAYINYVAPDYMVSVHVNSAENQGACGAIVFYNLTSQTKWNDWSEPAAEYIADAIDEYVMISAPTKLGNEITHAFASYAVTRDTHAPGCLIEMGYATNEVDAQNLLREDWQRSMAQGIAAGIARFFDSLEQ